MSEEGRSSLKVLQNAAQQVAQEDRSDGRSALLAAAGQESRPQPSSTPVRSRNRGDRGLNNFNIDGIDLEASQIDEDAEALLTQMSAGKEKKGAFTPPLSPKASRTVVGFDDDVNALFQLAGKELPASPGPASGESEEASPPAEATKPKPPKKTSPKKKIKSHRYMLGLNQKSSRSSTSSIISLRSHPSLIAKLLSEADHKPFGDNIRRSFRSETEEMLFRTMQEIQFAKTRGKDHKDSSTLNSRSMASSAQFSWQRMSMDRLSKSSKTEPDAKEMRKDRSLAYLLYDEAKECTFRPSLHAKRNGESKRNRDDDEKKEDSKYSFISRQEAEERARREELAFNIAKAEYDARLDKKVCPVCGISQSYVDVKEKRKHCQTCRAEYRHPLTWSQVCNKFFRNSKQFSQRVLSKLEKIKKELDKEYKYIERKRFNEKTGLIELFKEERKLNLSAVEEAEFFRRLDEKIKLREKNLKEIEADAYQHYTFKPVVSKRSKFGDDGDDDDLGGDDDDEDLEDPVRAFLRRYDEDMELRRDKMPQKYLPIRKHDADSLAQPKSFRF